MRFFYLERGNGIMARRRARLNRILTFGELRVFLWLRRRYLLRRRRSMLAPSSSTLVLHNPYQSLRKGWTWVTLWARDKVRLTDNPQARTLHLASARSPSQYNLTSIPNRDLSPLFNNNHNTNNRSANPLPTHQITT